MMNLTKLILKPNEEERILGGHPWIFSNEVAAFEGELKSGEIVSVYDNKNQFVGKGFFNSASKIICRVITLKEEEITKEFFRKRILEANAKRKQMKFSDHYRMVFGESDYLPGFIVDKYADYFVIQVLSLGIEQIKPLLIEILVEEFSPLGIYERSDVSVRIKEGLEEYKGVVYGTVPKYIQVNEDGLLLDVDVKNGQKTGLFLDQSINHTLVKDYASGLSVLDCFSHNGQFALHAKIAGATTVEAVDISGFACDMIRHNAELNHLDLTVTEGNVFEILRDYGRIGKLYDMIILDPPAFTKTKTKLENAYRGYKEINIQAMKLCKDNGLLITASCSQHLTPALFFQMLEDAQRDAGKSVQMLDFRIQASDHPMRLGSEESLYLKLAILRITDLK